MSKSTKKPVPSPAPESSTPVPNIVAVDQMRWNLVEIDSINRRGERIFRNLSLVYAALTADPESDVFEDAIAGVRDIVGEMCTEAYWLQQLPDEVGNLPCPNGLDDEVSIKAGAPICVLTKHFHPGGAR